MNPIKDVEARVMAAFLLEIDLDATDSEALASFRSLTARHHPNNGGDATIYNAVIGAWAMWNKTGHVVLTDDDLNASFEAAVKMRDRVHRGEDSLTAALEKRQGVLAVEPAVEVEEVAAEEDDVTVLDLTDAAEDVDAEVVPAPESLRHLPSAHRAYVVTGQRRVHELLHPGVTVDVYA